MYIDRRNAAASDSAVRGKICCWTFRTGRVEILGSQSDKAAQSVTSQTALFPPGIQLISFFFLFQTCI